MKPSGQHIEFLDEIRRFAILVVFLFHSIGPAFRTEPLPWGGWFRSLEGLGLFLLSLPFSSGYFGAAMFLAFSGFYIHLSVLKKARLEVILGEAFFPYLSTVFWVFYYMETNRVVT